MTSDIALIGTQEIVRTGLQPVLEGLGWNVSASFGKLTDCEIADLPKLVVLLDLAAEDDASTLLDLDKAIKIILVDQSDNARSLTASVLDRIDGHLAGNSNIEMLDAALRLVLGGHTISLRDRGLSAHTTGTDEYLIKRTNITDREAEVLALLIKGLPNKAIAREMDLTEATVKVHVKALLRKLEVENRTQAALLAQSASARR